MNTRLKFKAWHKTEKVMYDAYGFGETTVQLQKDNIYKDEQLKNVVVLQSIGVADKNRQPIMEGHVLRGTTKKGGFTAQVKWDDKKAGYVLAYGQYTLSIEEQVKRAFDKTLFLETFEIVGNIYENEDLKKIVA